MCIYNVSVGFFFYIRHLNLEDFFSRGVTHVFTDRLGRDGQEAHFGFYLLFFFSFCVQFVFLLGGGLYVRELWVNFMLQFVFTF